MRGIALLLFGVVVLVVSPSLALTGYAAEQDIAFETISLTHLRAGEIAPLFAPHFCYAGELAGSGASQLPSSSSGLLPDGVKLITAPNQSSRYLLVAGTAEAVAELRDIVVRFDVTRRTVQLSVKVYPSLPQETSGWHDLSAKNGVSAATAHAGGRRAPAVPCPPPRLRAGTDRRGGIRLGSRVRSPAPPQELAPGPALPHASRPPRATPSPSTSASGFCSRATIPWGSSGRPGTRPPRRA